MLAEDDTASPKETRESLMSEMNLPGHSLQGPAGSVSGFRALEEVCGRSRRLLRLVPPAVRLVPSA